MMRCLRCAIEYGPDEQFCQRCGRALSRPLGEKPPVVESTAGTQSDARFFYTTTAPPLQAGKSDRVESALSGTPIIPAVAPGVWGSAVESAVVPNNATEPAADWDSWTAGQSEDRLPSTPARRALPSLPPARWVDPSAGSGPPRAGEAVAWPTIPIAKAETLIAPPANPAPSTLSDDFFGDDDGEGSALVGRGVRGGAGSRIGGGKGTRLGSTKAGSARSLYRTTPAGDKWSKSRSLVLAAIVAVVIVALGSYAFTKQRAYNADLTKARNLALAGQYTGALTEYNKAMADWPFNGDASAGANSVRDAAAAVQEQARAAALIQARNNATRQGMLQAHMDLILQEVAGKS